MSGPVATHWPFTDVHSGEIHRFTLGSFQACQYCTRGCVEPE